MLEIRDLSFSYGDFEIDGISFTVQEGEVITLLGPNGSGKTTILKTVYGLLPPRKGRVLLDGADLHSFSMRERARLIGYVPQSHTPPFPYSVLETVVIGLASQLGLFESPGREHYKKALEKLRLLGLEHLKDKPYTRLSGGQIQLVLIARALVSEPRVLLLDEPTAHLDFKNQAKVLGIVKRLAKEEGISAVMTLHDPNLASLYSDRIALVKNGKIRAIGRPKDVLTESTLEEIYGIPVYSVEFNGFRLVLPRSETGGDEK